MKLNRRLVFTLCTLFFCEIVVAKPVALQCILSRDGDLPGYSKAPITDLVALDDERLDQVVEIFPEADTSMLVSAQLKRSEFNPSTLFVRIGFHRVKRGSASHMDMDVKFGHTDKLYYRGNQHPLRFMTFNRQSILSLTLPIETGGELFSYDLLGGSQWFNGAPFTVSCTPISASANL